MRVHTEITDEDLDVKFPDPDDDGDGEHAWGVHVLVMATDGSRRGATVQEDDEGTPEQVAEAIVRCAFAAAGLHSPAAVAALATQLAEPAETKD